MSSALVSICIPTYAGEQYLADAIQSVLDQNYRSLEVIIVDDCSPDSTAEVVAKFKDDRIHYFRNEVNLGPEGNWNRCLELANGDYYKLLPHDDILMPDCIETQVSVFEADIEKKIALVFGGKAVINADGKSIVTRIPLGKRALTLKADELIQKCIRSGANIIGEPGCGLIRSELIDKVGPYNADYPYVIDLDYWFRVLLHGDAHSTGKITSKFRISENAWSTKIGKKQHSDYFGMVEKYSADPRYKINAVSKLLGKINSYIVSLMRRTLYLWLRASKSFTGIAKG